MPTTGRDDAVTCEYVSKPYELVENRVSPIESCIRAISPQMRRQVRKQFLASDHDEESIKDRGEPIYTPFTGVSGPLVRNVSLITRGQLVKRFPEDLSVLVHIQL